MPSVFDQMETQIDVFGNGQEAHVLGGVFLRLVNGPKNSDPPGLVQDFRWHLHHEERWILHSHGGTEPDYLSNCVR